MDHILPVSELIEQVAHLDSHDFERISEAVQARRRAEHQKTQLSKAESVILQKINIGFSTEKWERLQYLTEKMEADQIEGNEHLELEMLAAEYETFTVDRIEWMVQLAEIRKSTLDEVVERFELQPQ